MMIPLTKIEHLSQETAFTVMSGQYL